MALLFSLTLALTPSLAEARAGTSFGGGFSGMGSRGTRSFENNGAAPLGRSMETPSAGIGSGLGYGGGSFFSRHPFLTGIFGGFLGASLFGGGFFGHAFGGLFSLLIIGFLIFFVFRLLSGAFAGGGGGFAPRSVGAAAAPARSVIAAVTSPSATPTSTPSSHCTRRSRKPGAVPISRRCAS